MDVLINRNHIVSEISEAILDVASVAGEEIDGMRVIQLLAGLLTETALLFEDPDEALVTCYAFMAKEMNTEPLYAAPSPNALPPAYLIDSETERGRKIGRDVFEEFLDCPYDFKDIVLHVVISSFHRFSVFGQSRKESFRLLIECANKALAYEIAVQELCDVLISKTIAPGTTCSSLNAIEALCVSAGRHLGSSQSIQQADEYNIFQSSNMLPDLLDQVFHVMQDEASRHGIPKNLNWGLGIVANDCDVLPNLDHVLDLELDCEILFAALKLHSMMDRGVALAKTAGRMIAFIASGDEPEIEPAVVRPVAMMALSDMYRSMTMQPHAAQR